MNTQTAKLLTGGGKLNNNNIVASALTRSQAKRLAEPLGLSSEISLAMNNGRTPAQALEDWDILLFSADGTVSPLAADSYAQVAGVTIEEALERREGKC